MLSLAGRLPLRPVKSATIISLKELNLDICAKCVCTASFNKYPSSYNRFTSVHNYQARWYSNKEPQRKAFFGGIVQDFLEGVKKDDSIQENIKKFREKSKQLEESDALKKARAKFEAIEKEGRQSEQLKQTFSNLKETVERTTEEIGKSESGQKLKKLAGDVGETVGKTAETVAKGAESISQTAAFQSVSKGAKVIKDEVQDISQARSHIYTSPETLYKRSHYSAIQKEEKEIDADTESTGMVMHKDSQKQQWWQNIKENNKVVDKMFEYKMKYDESDHVMVRLTRSVTDKFSGLFGSIFKPSELSAVMTEITKIDPTFEKETFLNNCRRIFIPNILEAVERQQLDVLESWCYEAEFNKLAMPIKQVKERSLKRHGHILDIGHIDLVGGSIQDNGPVLIIQFTTQNVVWVEDAKGAIVEGDPDKVYRITNVWALCRDQEDLDPRTAWRLIESHSHAQELLY